MMTDLQELEMDEAGDERIVGKAADRALSGRSS
jgi:hypothetical protein